MSDRTFVSVAAAGIFGCFLMADNPLFALPEPVRSAAAADTGLPLAPRTLEAARVQASETLAMFLRHAVGPDGRAAEGAALQVALPAEDGPGLQVVLVSDVRVDNIQFSGVVEGRPGRVSFDPSHIRDWIWRGEDGRLYGSYIARASLPSFHPSAAAALGATLSEDPVPAVWR
ncbi:hypothetical protein [Oceanicola granulosus]|nr:hypothetical protein [Oceanicola granulosus]